MLITLNFKFFIMRKYLLLFVLTLFFFDGFSKRKVNIDSLKSAIPNVEGAEKIKLLRDIAFYSSFSNAEEAILYAEKAIKYAKSINHVKGFGASKNELGSIHLKYGNYTKATKLYDEALTAFESIDDQEEVAYVLNNIGRNYYNQADYTKALEYVFRSLKIKKALQIKNIHNTITLIGDVFRDQKEYDKALLYYEEALDYCLKDNNEYGMAGIYNDMEIVYRKKRDFEKALELRNKCILLDKKTGNDHGLSVSYNNLGELYNDLGKYLEAIQSFNKSLKIKKRLNNSSGLAHTFESLADTYLLLGKLKDAEAAAKKSIQISSEIGENKKLMDAYETIATIYKKQKQFEKGLDYHIKYSMLKDSILNENKNELLADMEAKYQNSEKEAENALLKIAGMEQDALIKKKNFWMTIYALGVALLIVVSIFIYRAYTLQSRTNKLLGIQKEKLSVLNATKDRFFGIIAHDLRGPITALQGITGLLNYNIRKNDVESLHGIAQQIEDSALKVNTLLDNLLKWAILTFFSDMAKAKEIEINAEIPKELHVHADRETMSTVFRNLVNNSIKFTQRGGNITLRASITNDLVTIEVQDNGKGMTPHKLKHIFTLDYAKVSDGTEAEKGTGLGLVLVHDFVNLNHGKISVESELNKGSKFSISIPNQLQNAS